MGVFDKLERRLERAVKQPFARIFKAEVQPVEIASAMRRSMDDRAAVLGPGRTMVPNVFTIELAETDYERLSSYDRALTDELIAAAEDHADAQRYVSPGPYEVRLVSGDDLETGIFRIRPASKDGRRGSAPEPRRRPTPRPERDRSADQGEDRESQDHVDAGAAYRRPTQTAQAPVQPRRPASSGHAPVTLEVDGLRIPLTGAVSTIGRDESCTVVVDDAGASRRHAEIRITHDGPHLQVLLRDLGSTNGTYLNGEQVGTEELRRGDRITLGRTHLTVDLEA
ncbi:FhaA domain-containing protein [Ornithinimicrobium pratense]|uniref:DUF2662 domain-containing protein n=1 Tax=Ornithinimicrobium pratense TaxID=2593973 RepID=A0A5J6V2J2_9MICO|nr:DUF3662 and FHA domain-containing protein [Ornithinimicrobium pratense]QFG67371.1 DUF2662 domain-containing protein [Ornithinimicrobium pratense]